MKHRWYDNDPTLSMAVSLLQNASRIHQEMTAHYIRRHMERESILEKERLGPPGQLLFLFPFLRRNRLEKDAWELLEMMKRLPKDIQLELALMMINYIYMLDAGTQPPAQEEQPVASGQHEAP